MSYPTRNPITAQPNLAERQARLTRLQARAENMDRAWCSERRRLFPDEPLPEGRWVQQPDGSWRREESLN